MARRTCETIHELPPFQEPVTVVSVEIFRDGGSTEVVLEDRDVQRLELYFDYRIGTYPHGRLYLKANATDCIHPIAQDSQAERDVVRLLRQHLNSNYTEEEQQRLDDLDGCKGVYGLSKRDHDGFLLLRCLKQVEELRKLAIFGIIDRV